MKQLDRTVAAAHRNAARMRKAGLVAVGSSSVDMGSAVRSGVPLSSVLAGGGGGAAESLPVIATSAPSSASGGGMSPATAYQIGHAEAAEREGGYSSDTSSETQEADAGAGRKAAGGKGAGGRPASKSVGKSRGMDVVAATSATVPSAASKGKRMLTIDDDDDDAGEEEETEGYCSGGSTASSPAESKLAADVQAVVAEAHAHRDQVSLARARQGASLSAAGSVSGTTASSAGEHVQHRDSGPIGGKRGRALSSAAATTLQQQQVVQACGVPAKSAKVPDALRDKRLRFQAARRLVHLPNSVRERDVALPSSIAPTAGAGSGSGSTSPGAAVEVSPRQAASQQVAGMIAQPLAHVAADAHANVPAARAAWTAMAQQRKAAIQPAGASSSSADATPAIKKRRLWFTLSLSETAERNRLLSMTAAAAAREADLHAANLRVVAGTSGRTETDGGTSSTLTTSATRAIHNPAIVQALSDAASVKDGEEMTQVETVAIGDEVDAARDRGRRKVGSKRERVTGSSTTLGASGATPEVRGSSGATSGSSTSRRKASKSKSVPADVAAAGMLTPVIGQPAQASSFSSSSSSSAADKDTSSAVIGRTRGKRPPQHQPEPSTKPSKSGRSGRSSKGASMPIDPVSR